MWQNNSSQEIGTRVSNSLDLGWYTPKYCVGTYTPKKNHASLFPHSYLRGDSNDEFYSEHSPQQIIKNYVAQGEITYDAISMMAVTYLTDKDDFIIEGYHVTPEIVDRIYKKFGKEHVKAVFLVKYDEWKFIQDIHKSTTSNDWIIRKTKDKTTYGRIAKIIAEYSRYFEREAKKYGFKIFNMDNDFEKQLNTIEKNLESE